MNCRRRNAVQHHFTGYAQRPGVLLLVVLSMLTLFLMLGAAYLIMASRARDVARAFARLTLESDQSRVNHAQCLDNVLMTVIRGGAAPAFTGTATTISFESLLADRYGAGLTMSGSATVTGTSGPLVYATCALNINPSVHPALLNGRVFTFVPDAGGITSHRVLRATGDGPTYALVLGPAYGKDFFSAPPANSRCIINGREFSGDGTDNEEHDGFDHDKNPFLAYLSPAVAPADSVCSKMSYANGVFTGDDNGLPIAADNDGDGEPDALFLDFGFPPLALSNGDSVRLDASVLIVDLDSRFNVNAHGSLSPATYLTSGTAFHPGWPTSSGAVLKTGTYPITSPFIPFGTGYGPAEVSAEKIRFMHTYNRPDDESPLAFAMLGGPADSQIGRRTYGSRFYTSGTAVAANQALKWGDVTPRLTALQGRYGDPYSSLLPAGTGSGRTWGLFGSTFQSTGWARPGIAGQNDALSRVTDELSSNASVNEGIPATWWSGSSAMPSSTAVFNSPPDLQGRMKTVTNPVVSGSAIVPSLWHAKPEWGNDTVDDPYEIALADRSLRNATYVTGSTVADNPFSYSELERILRPYDIDSRSLAPRLAALLGSAAEEARLLVTTDSWDTTAVTGVVARKLRDWIAPTGGPLLTTDASKLYASGTGATAATSGILSGELARGEKLDLSRPLTGTKPPVYSASDRYYLQRQALFKDLYTAMVMVTGSATAPANHRDLAQWAANVVEFRDADSTMTPFEYDTNPRNGWDVDGDAASDTGDSDRGVVFGAERPEIVITEAFAWENTSQTPNKGGLVVALHRPWDAKAFGSGSGVTPGEPCDAALAVTNTNILDLGKKTDGSDFPIWRLRLVRGNSASCVRFDTTSTSSGGNFVRHFGARVNNSSPQLDTNATLCVTGTSAYLKNNTWTAIPISASAIVATVAIGEEFKLPADASNTATIYLERLSDPTAVVAGADGDAKWNANALATASAMASGSSAASIALPMYRIVDALTVTVQSTNGGQNPDKTVRKLTDKSVSEKTALWRSSEVQNLTLSEIGGYSNTTQAAWYHWPNRPLISPIELLLVPGGDAAVMLNTYAQPTATANALYAFDSSMSLLDAVTVPTRFAGVHQTHSAWPSAMQNGTGIFAVVKPVNQISSYREPGRINMNTVTGYYEGTSTTVYSEVWDALIAGPLPYPTTPFDQSTFAFRPRRTSTAKAVPADPKLGIPATPAVPGSGNNKKGTTTIENPAVPGQSLSAAIITSAGEEKFLDLIAGSSPPTYTSSFMGSAARAGLNPYHKLSTAIRLGNTATVRSNVFGIWITLRDSVPGDPDSVKLHRAFYIVDRSIPVGFENGKDHNVRDMIQLRRIIE